MDEDRSINALEVTADGLLRLSRRNAQLTRRTYQALAESLSGRRETDLVLSDRQRSMVSQMLRQMVGEIEAAIRWHVVAHLEDGEFDGFQPDIAVAGCENDIVFTFLLERGLLRDFDLVEAVLHRLCQHQLETGLQAAQAGGTNAEPGLDRPGEFFFPPLPDRSPVHRRVAAYVVDRSRRTDSYGTPVLMASDLDGALYARLYWRAAAALRQGSAPLSLDNASARDTVLESATSDAQRQAAALASAPTSTAEACSSLEVAGLLSVETVMRLLRAGEIPLFEVLFARLSGIRPVLLRRLIYEPGGEGIVILARALGMDSDAATDVFALTRPAGRGLYLDGGDYQDRFQAVFEGTSRQDAEQVRAYWARGRDYVRGLWEAETGSVGETPLSGR